MTHLLDRATLERLSRVENRTRLREILEDGPRHDLVSTLGTQPVRFHERALIRSVAARFALLYRWAYPRADVLDAVFLPFDARTLRGIARGISGGMPPEDRIRDAVPTPTLDVGSLRFLSESTSVQALGATLTAWGHPLAEGLTEIEPGVSGRPDLFAVEAGLGRASSRAVVEAARRGDDPLRRWANEEVDAWNVVAALVLASVRGEMDPRGLYVEGGTVLGPEDFLAATESEGRLEAYRVLEGVTRGTLFATALEQARSERGTPGAAATALEKAILDARIDRLAGETRRHPLSSAPVLLYVSRNVREVRVLRRALWRTGLPSRRAS